MDSAASAEELSAQAQSLQDIASELALLVDGERATGSTPRHVTERKAAPAKQPAERRVKAAPRKAAPAEAPVEIPHVGANGSRKQTE